MYKYILIFLLLFSFSAHADNTYNASVTRVVDGDTMDVLIELPLGIILKERVRILDFDAPETWRPKSEEERIAGEAATAKAKELLAKGDIKISIHGRGNFGRVLVHITLADGRDFATVMKELGMEK